MTHTHTPRIENGTKRDEEVLYYVERMETPLGDEKDGQECMRWMRTSSENVGGALDVLALEAALRQRYVARERNGLGNDLDHWIAVARAATAGPEELEDACEPSTEARAVRLMPPYPNSRVGGRPIWWRFVVAAAVAILVAVVGLGYWLETEEVPPDDVGRRVELPGMTVMTTYPHTRARVNFTLLKRDIELLSGEASFDVGDDARPFRVLTPQGAVTALGTRFDVSLDGPANNRQMLVRVWQGKVIVESNAALVPGSWVLKPDDEARFASNGLIGITKIPRGSAAVLTEFSNEPLGRLAAKIKQTDPGPRVVIVGKACSYPVSGSFDLQDPTSLIDHVRNDPRLIGPEGDVVVVRLVTDTSSAQGSALSGCDVDLGDSTIPAMRGDNRDRSPQQSDGQDLMP